MGDLRERGEQNRHNGERLCDCEKESNPLFCPEYAELLYYHLQLAGLAGWH
jgi:hypothetical protein